MLGDNFRHLAVSWAIDFAISISLSISCRHLVITEAHKLSNHPNATSPTTTTITILSNYIMKLSTASAVVAYILASSASAADVRKTSKLRADDAASVNRRVEEEPNWWPKPPEPPSPCDVREQCNGGFTYYTVFTGEELNIAPVESGLTTITEQGFAEPNKHYQWTKFYAATPDNCVLAPIDTENDLIRAIAAVKADTDVKQNAWVGLWKDAVDVCPNYLTTGCSEANTDNQGGWRNLDGSFSSIANDANIAKYWRDGEPNNRPKIQTYVHLWAQDDEFLLRDDNDRGAFHNEERGLISAAVYKCCGPAGLDFLSCDE